MGIIRGVNQPNYNYYSQYNNGYNNFTHANSYNTLIFKGNNHTIIGDSYNNKTVIPKDGKDDGSIGFLGAVQNLVKGVGNFFKGMVCDENGKFSVGRTLTTIGIGAAIGLACTFFPVITVAGTTLSTLGVISTGFLGLAGLHAGKSVLDIVNAKTDAEAEKAWQNMGLSITEGGFAYLGYRASGGIFAKDVVPTTPSSSTPKTPKTEPFEQPKASTPKTEPMIEPPKAEAVVETKPIESEVPLVETVTEEPVTTTSVTEPITKPIEKPTMTMTDEMSIIQTSEDLHPREYISITENIPKDGDFKAICVGTGGKDSPNGVINTYLRTGEIHPEWTKGELDQIIASADNVFTRNKLSRNTILHRQVNNIDYIPEIGELYTEKGYTATSMKERFSDYGYGNIQVDIFAPAETNCYIPGNYFYEVVINRNTTFKVLDKQDNYVALLIV